MVTWNEANDTILSALDVRAEYEALGVRFTAGDPNRNGWLECHAAGRDDRNPSAAVNVQTGYYVDRGGESLSLSLYDFGARFGPFADWRDARKHYAQKAGVKLPRGRPPADPAEHLEFFAWDRGRVALWCRHKPPITPEAVAAAGGRLAYYRKQWHVVALPIFGAAGLAGGPVGWCLLSTSGKQLPVYRKGANAPVKLVKIKTTHGSEAGLLGFHALDRLKHGTPPEVIWKVAGPTDLLALWSVIPAEQRDAHLVVSNAFGESETPTAGMLGTFKGAAVRVVHDADTPGEAGAVKWGRALTKVATEARIVRLPYPVQRAHGKDVRDWLTEGHTYQELLDLAAQADVAQPDTRPTIVDDPDEARVVDLADLALAAQPIFQRGRKLVQVAREMAPPPGIARPKGAPRISLVRLARLRELLASGANFVRIDGEGNQQPIHPPPWVVQALDARDQWQHVRVLEAIIESPTLLADGSIHQIPGYDDRSGLLYEPHELGNAQTDIPDTPTSTEVKQARDLLSEPVQDFPFAAETHRAAWVAAVLTCFTRLAFHGPAPLFLIDANVRGCGKSLLADVVSLIATGRELARTTAPDNDEEMRKRVLAIALAGENLVLLDNVASALGSPALDAALTGTTFADRLLGKNEMANDIPLLCTWLATGNNVVLQADTSRRVCHVRLESSEENPERRTGFRHPRLLGWVRWERPRLVTAVLTILRGFCAAGRPDQGLPPWGSFEGWSDLVRGAVVWAGLPDPGETREELAAQADTEANALRSLIDAWARIDPEGYGLSVASVLDKIEHQQRMPTMQEEYAAVRDALLELAPARGTGLPSAKSVGRKLTSLRRRIIGGRCLDRKDHRHGHLWLVRSTARRFERFERFIPATPCEEGKYNVVTGNEVSTRWGKPPKPLKPPLDPEANQAVEEFLCN